jgi:PASTA domain
VILAAALALLGVVALAALILLAVALSDGNDASNTASRSTAPPTTSYSLPTVATTLPTTSTAPPTTTPTVKVPNLVGMNLVRAKPILADRGLRGTIRYRSTARYPAGTVISQSHRTGARVGPDTRITVVVAKAPPPPATTAPPTSAPRNCDPSYPDVCLNPNAEDYDCAGGSGNGPLYVEGPISVSPPDPFGLDADGDGVGCERD